MNGFSAKIAYVCLIGAYALASSGGVICFGEDGHIAVEAAFHDHCGSEDSHSEHHDVNSENHDSYSSSCNPCTDIPLAGEIILTFSAETALPDNYQYSVVVNSYDDHSNTPNPGPDIYTPYFSPLKNIIILS